MICGICPHHCDIREGQIGFCRARANVDGEIRCINYGRLSSLALDPIEKKPLRMFYPGSRILSVGSFGCNLRCSFCQNYKISMADDRIETAYVSPEQLIEKAVELKEHGNIGIAYTYNEPLVGYEYVRDCAVLAHEEGLKNVLVTNGYICSSPLQELLPYIDAVNIDLKGFTEDFYKKISADLETVKASIEACAKVCHVEVTTLIIPGENDSPEEMEEEAKWVSSVNKKIPLHISRFYPQYKMTDRDATSVDMIYELRDIASNYLNYVYTGNC